MTPDRRLQCRLDRVEEQLVGLPFRERLAEQVRPDVRRGRDEPAVRLGEAGAGLSNSSSTTTVPVPTGSGAARIDDRPASNGINSIGPSVAGSSAFRSTGSCRLTTLAASDRANGTVTAGERLPPTLVRGGGFGPIRRMRGGRSVHHRLRR